ncbi:selenocysteine lyase [Parasteatoda tepidariorum]|uniref:selenocysteine lyase n=1 Tax=Parasteatoda tepidariorum TaxID=114398 RepID=UPI001C71FA20|nr:selenocysteine lyase [Parasteatoda tepidariorum]
MVVYLDCNATTPIDSDVCETITSALSKVWGNPSSSYAFGKEAHNIIQESRIKVASMIGCNSDEIIFTSGGTESNNMAIHTAVKHFYSNARNGTKPHIITSNIEHDSVILYLETLFSSKEIDLTIIPVSKTTGSFHVDDVMNAIRPNTCLITIMLANNETGVIQPVKALGECLKNSGHKILFHTDAAQAVGKISVEVQDLGVDYLTIVGHKFYGPRIGALYFRQGKPLYPLFYGGGQERKYRPGTENTCMIAGLGKACELIVKNLELYNEHMTKVCNYLKKSLIEAFSDRIIFNVKPNVDRLPNTLSVAFDFDGMTGHEILAETKEICASTGAACHSGNSGSFVLVSSGVPEHLSAKSLRLSVGRETGMSDIDKAVQSLKKAVERLNKL